MTPIEGFRINIARARMLGDLYTALASLTTSAIDSSDILRSQIILSVSAFDFYIHEVVRQGILDIYVGARPHVDGFKKINVSLMDAKQSVPGGAVEWLDASIRHQHSFLSFQQPDKVADAIRLIYSDPLWERLEKRLGISAQNLKGTLRLIVDRRNKIAHESDSDPSYPGGRWPITKEIVDKASQFIENICEAINLELDNPRQL